MSKRRQQQEQQQPQQQDDAGPSRKVKLDKLPQYTFLQALMERGVMSEKAAQELLQQVIPNFNGTIYRKVLSDANNELHPMSFEVKSMKFLVDGEVYVGFINTHADEPSKLVTKYKHQEKEYFKTVIETIAAEDAADGELASISTVNLLNLDPTKAGGTQATQATQGSSQASKLTLKEKQDLLKTLAEEKWLERSEEEDSYSIGVRTFMELGGYLLQLEDVPSATKEIWKSFL